MLNAKDINDRLLRLELAVSNIVGDIANVNKEVKQLMEEIRAQRITSTTTDDASDSPRSETEGRQGTIT